jgi:type VI secretion system ImpH/TssG family protein
VHYAALFASRRSAVAIEDALTDLLGTRVRVSEFAPRWREVEPDDQTRLGRDFAMLGRDAMAGRRVKSASDAFRVTVHAQTLAEAEALLPSGATFAILADAITAFAPGHLEWDLVVELREAQARAARLDGRSRLGWTGWLSPDAAGAANRSDIRLRRTAIRAARRFSGGR